MNHIREFYEQVKKQSELFHPEDPSTFAFATLLYPSKYCWFKDDGLYPSKNYQNKLGMMKSLNNKIIQFNNNVLQEQVPFYKKMMGDDCGVGVLVSKAPRALATTHTESGSRQYARDERRLVSRLIGGACGGKARQR